LIGGNDARWNVVERNEEQIKALVEEGQKFWDLIEKRIPPEPDGTDSAGETLGDIYPGGMTGSIALDGMAGVLESMKRFEAAEKEAKAAKDECKQKIMQAMGNFEAATIGNVKVTWKTQAGRVTVDSKKLKAEMPDIYEKYSKTGKPIRVFRA
jgi:predicted phage-related endonuclease